MPARLLLALLLPVCFGVAAHAQAIERPLVRVLLAPEVRDQVSGVAWNAMTAECQRIWTREGVEIAWAGDTPGMARPDVTLPIVFHQRELQKHDSGSALGITLFAGRSQRILVSASRAREQVRLRRGLANSGDGLTLDIALGQILGRVVAHEVGHVLLLTTRHAASGLMSPSLEARDVGRPVAEVEFALTTMERDRLATRFSNALAPVEVAARRPLLVGTPASREPAVVPITWSAVPPAPSQPRGPR